MTTPMHPPATSHVTHGPAGQPAPAEPSLRPSEGWHCTHLDYRFDRRALKQLSAAEIADGATDMIATLDPTGPGAPARMPEALTFLSSLALPTRGTRGSFDP